MASNEPRMGVAGSMASVASLVGTPRGARLRTLAELEGITLRELAVKLEMPQTRLSELIQGRRPFPESLVYRAASMFDVPRTFFNAVTVPQEDAAVTFRKRSTTTARQEKRIAALYREASRAWRMISLQSGYKTKTLPSGDDRADAETAAEAVRALSSLAPDAPVPNVTRLIERLGIAVISGLDPASPPLEFSGCTSPSIFEDRPLISIVSAQPGAVARMTLAHELGHQIFDDDLEASPRSRDVEERRAFNFAGALLLPASVMRRQVDEYTTLRQMLELKAKFGVSVGAIVSRAATLGLISPERKRSLNIQINGRGWRYHEPVPVGDEKPLLLGQGIRRAWGSVAKAASVTGVPAGLLAGWIGEPLPAPENQELADVVDVAEWRRARRR